MKDETIERLYNLRVLIAKAKHEQGKTVNGVVLGIDVCNEILDSVNRIGGLERHIMYEMEYWYNRPKTETLLYGIPVSIDKDHENVIRFTTEDMSV